MLDAKQVIALARSALERAFSGQSAVTPDASGGAITACVNIRVRGASRGCWSGEATTLASAIEAAVHGALLDARYSGPLSRGEQNQARLEVWIQTGRKPIAQVLPRHLWGTFGIEVRSGRKHAYFLPYVAVEGRYRSASELQEQLYRKARLWSADSRQTAQLFETEWMHLAEDTPTAVQLFRFRKIDTEKRPSLMCMAEQTARHLLNIQRFDGSYLYEYDPLHGSTNNNTNAIRVILCTYALARFAAFLAARSPTDNTAAPFAEGARRGLQYIHGHLTKTARGSLFQDHAGETNLGSNALALLAASYAPSLDIASDISVALIEPLLNSQSPQGWFPEHPLRPETRGQQDFAPGQLIMALLKQEVLPPEKVLPSIEKAFGFYSDQPIQSATYFFLAWQGKAWCETWRRTRRREYAETAFRLLDRLAAFQIRAADDCPLDFVGGYKPNVNQPVSAPPTSLVSLFTEATILGEHVAAEFGDPTRAASYKDTVLQGIDCIDRLQISHEQQILFADPELPIGGMRRDLASFDMRCDHAAHALTCLTTALELERQA